MWRRKFARTFGLAHSPPPLLAPNSSRIASSSVRPKQAPFRPRPRIMDPEDVSARCHFPGSMLLKVKNSGAAHLVRFSRPCLIRARMLTRTRGHHSLMLPRPLHRFSRFPRAETREADAGPSLPRVGAVAKEGAFGL